jgi:hypothetical protein
MLKPRECHDLFNLTESASGDSVGNDERSRAILEIVKGLCRQLGLSNYNPQSLLWSDYAFDTGEHISPLEMAYDRPILFSDKIVLRKKARDVLEPEEWKSIIAPALIAKKRWPHAVRNMALTIFGSLLVALVAGTLALPFLFPEQTVIRNRVGDPLGLVNAAGLSYFLIGIIVYIILGFLLFLRWAKRLGRRAERETVQLIGKEQYLKTFKKLEDFLSSLPAGDERDKDLARVRERIREAQVFQPTPSTSAV